jgi:hypothetical protein
MDSKEKVTAVVAGLRMLQALVEAGPFSVTRLEAGPRIIGDLYDGESVRLPTSEELDALCDEIGLGDLFPDNPEPPPEICCRAHLCPRRYRAIAQLQDEGKEPDPFWWSADFEAWVCPDCGGTDVR